MRGIDKVLLFLQENPNHWHYGRDIAKAAAVARSGVYIHLGRLEDEGKIARRLEPEPCTPGYMRRTQYKVTEHGRRDPVEVVGGVFA